VNLPKVTSKLVIIMQVKIQVKDRSNRNGNTKPPGCIPVVPSLLREVRLRWRGVAPQRPPTPQRLTLFQVNMPQRRVHAPLSGALEGGTRPSHKVLGRDPQLNWRLPISPPSSYTQRLSLGGDRAKVSDLSMRSRYVNLVGGVRA
jgi:hypothetical protein